MKCGIQTCKEKAVWIHTYYSTLSVCENHYKTAAATMLGTNGGSKKSTAKTNAARINGKKGGRPLKEKVPQPKQNTLHSSSLVP